jgi:quercetin dioxygenase-like cupin family protein
MWIRKRHAASLAAVIVSSVPALVFATSPARSTEATAKGKHAIVQRGTEVQWSAGPASLPPGAEVAVLEGDPAKDGMYSMRLRVPSGYRIPPHTHPKIERVTVINGELGLGMGSDFDESRLERLPAGSFFVLEPGMQHFVQATAQTVIQLNGIGPWAIKYVRASDDPRNQPQARKAPPPEGTRKKP